MAEKNNLPAVRFTRFNECWNKRKLGEIANFTKGQGYSKKDLIESGTPIILYGRLYTEYQVEIDDVDTFVSHNQGGILSRGCEVVVPASGETSEDIARASAILKSGILLGGDLNIIYPDDAIKSVFLALAISNGKPKNELAKRAQGKSVVHLRNSDLQEVELNYPNEDEQTQIGSYFQHLDKLISLHQTKVSKLTNLKKAMLEKMFPKHGAVVPEIRYKGFEGAWEEKELGVITNTTIGEFVIKTRQNPNSPYPVFNGGKSYTGFYDEYNNEGNKVIISARGANAGYVNFAKNRFWAGNSCYSVEILDKDQFSIEFFYHYIKYNQNRFIENQQAANIPSVSKSDVEKFVISHPQFKEQVVIAEYFQNIDKLISLQETKLEKLGNLKKACLEKMFV